ncbi:transcriptional regulator [Streptococcus mutans 15VF2]|uniref:spr1629 family repressor/antitoxin n=1 Tax=Streptococcus mutans TaxID=1309 RepID=UPI0002B5F1BF|nr:XRE family transcriptional regulator [Streptococcus mutans]EMB74476.1 transcriptional regulator [Streptococcus mutans 15VF2]
MFNGSILKELRLLNGMSRQKLAEQLNLTEQAVWQFESGHAIPKMTTLFQLAHLFYVNTDYFEQESVPEAFDISAIAFRNGDSLAKKTISIQQAYLRKLSQMIDYLESFVEIPQLSIYGLADKMTKHYDEGWSIGEIAGLARRELGISGDNSDLMYQIEKSGIYVAEKVINGEADAYSAWSKDGRPFIILGIGKSAVRRNFDLAHELGHLLLHRSVAFDELDKDGCYDKEDEANLFASCFLLPEQRFREDFANIVGKRVSNPDNYIALKRKYHVSIQALEYRAYKLGLLTPPQNSYFYRQIAKKKYKVIEPLDLEIIVKKPSKVRSILDVILSNNLLTLEQLGANQKVSLQFFSQIFSFDIKFFDKYKANDIAKFDNVIPLKRNR